MLRVWSFVWRWIGNALRVKTLWELLVPPTVASGVAIVLKGFLAQPWLVILLSTLGVFAASVVAIRVIRSSMVVKGALRYVGLSWAGNHCFEGTMSICAMQVLNIRNIQVSIPVILRNVAAQVTYEHDDQRRRLIVKSGAWRNENLNDTNPLTGGIRIVDSINLEPGETQGLIVTIQRVRDGKVFVSPQNGEQFQDMEPGHWNVLVEIRSDNSRSVKLRGRFLIESVRGGNDKLSFDDQGFKQL